MLPGGETERVLNQVLADRLESQRSIPSSGGKTLLTRLMSSPTTTPRIPPGKLNTGNQSKSTVGLPKQGQVQPSPVAIATNRTSGQRLNPGGSGHHSRIADIDPDRAARIAVVDKEQAREDQYGPAHTIALTEGGLLAGLAGSTEVTVNSLHSQGVDRMGDGLVMEAIAPDGIIEAVRVANASTFALAVQWHPEWKFREDPFSLALFEAFGDAVKARAAARGSHERVAYYQPA